MYEFYIGNNLVCQDNNIDKVGLLMNKVLSQYNDCGIPLNVEIKGSGVVIKTYDNTMRLENAIFTPANLDILPYFLLNAKRLWELQADKMDQVVALNPHGILDVMTYRDWLINPYLLLTELFHINEELLYQTFILYLNKTISQHTQPNKVVIGDIVKDFGVGDVTRYYGLYSFYMHNKKILPFMSVYKPYVSALL